MVSVSALSVGVVAFWGADPVCPECVCDHCSLASSLYDIKLV